MMKYGKKLLFPLFVLGLTAMWPQEASASMIDTNRTGSISIYSMAVENPDEHTIPATGEEQEAEGDPLSNIRYTVTLVTEEASDPTDAKPLEGEGAYTDTISTDAYGRALFDGLTPGLYLVQQEESAALEETVEDFLVDIPMTDPTGTTRIYDVSVYPKYRLTGPPEIHAYITGLHNRSDSTALRGRSQWIVTAQIPADIASAKNYQIQSTMHEHLTFIDGSVTVYAQGGNTERVVLTPEDDYTVAEQDRVLNITLVESGLKKLSDLPESAGALLYMEFSTILDIPQEELAGALATPIDLQVRLDYTGSLGRPAVSVPEEAPYVYTGGMGIRKTAGGNNQPLSGASFKIYRTREDALAENNAIQTPGGTGDWVETTNIDGIAMFSGLAYGGEGVSNVAGSTGYYLVQTQAPAGYNLLRAPVEITVDATSHIENNEVVVQGRTGFLLPATGGMGTLWFTVVGLALMGLAVWLFWRRGKQRKKDDDS